ncbi:hypothetical protein, conserved [Trypanosoma brucei gambiense DAL972]|uniref:PA domain-containing protein n=2 Tax=Trypanosoma brucei TaxID=5691 RepID=D0A7M9_TRYB9|nr:hypothetical protein, conserved [Trypanosoma brucei gambiense DAL972]RHW67030.1 Enriched in surface-labeled proteome protein 7 [Trypanosoma brucei equiperdum]CBH17680.1 hypothetical protein, conserved [Trypanosoma brucei gambiense DAL972]|eukprot:XP_011779944.1 hypothetical protein, conserved [Trypanosoma brucei gambiense DAL972]
MALWLRVVFTIVAALLGAAVPVASLVVHRPLYLAKRNMLSTVPDYGTTPLTGRNNHGKVILVEMGALCNGNKVDPHWVDAVLLTHGGQCSHGTQAVRAQSAGAVGLLVANDGVGSADEAEVDIPVERITTKDYDAITNAVKNDVLVEVTLGTPLDVLRYIV